MVGDSGISDLSSGGIIDRGLVLLNVRLDGKELGDKMLAWNLVARVDRWLGTYAQAGR